MTAFLKKLLSGISIPQEYVCVGLEELSHPLRIFLDTDGGQKEISQNHLFLGYKPLIIAILFENVSDASNSPLIELRFDADHLKSETIAKLQLKKVRQRKIGDRFIVFYEGVNGSHRFLSRLHQLMNRILIGLKRKPEGNVSLNQNLYDQVRIAYSVARKISVITVGDKELSNVFPTDLHGAICQDYYASSLRINGEACKQVMTHQKLVISDVQVSEFRRVYSFGKNHMRAMQPTSSFEVSEDRSKVFHFPLPHETGSYYELEVVDHFDIGIHRIFLYKVVARKELKRIITLAHIHQYYAQWRVNQLLETKLLLR